MIWPRLNAAVMSAMRPRGSPSPASRAPIRPSAVRPMKVPPRKRAAITTPKVCSHSTLATTPAASTRLATAKAGRMPMRRPSAPHSTTEGAAPMPTSTQA